MDVTIAVCTYGSSEWAQLAYERAIPSAHGQGADRITSVHHPNKQLHEVRNAALEGIETEWVIFLDADDELEPGYVHAMGDVLAGQPATGQYDMIAPQVRYVRPQGVRDPYFPRVAGHTHECYADCLRDGNWLVIGTAVRTELAKMVGGFRDFAWSEDWDLWLRCWLLGGQIGRSPGSIYRAHYRADSRNRAPSRQFRNDVHRQIYTANFGAAA